MELQSMGEGKRNGGPPYEFRVYHKCKVSSCNSIHTKYYLCHSFQQVFHIPKLSVVSSEHSFNTINQILNGFTHSFCLLLLLCLPGSLGRCVLCQLFVSQSKPF